MADLNKPKKHRHKRHYTIMVISGDSDGSSGGFHLGHVATQVLAFSIFAVFLALVCFLVSSAITVSSLKKYSAQQDVKIAELDEENKALTQTNSELQNEVTQLSQALNQKVEAEAQTAAEAEQLSLPSQLPISGTASMVTTFDDPNSSEIAIAGLIDEDGNDVKAEENDENGDDNDEGDATTATPPDTSAFNPILLLKTEEGTTITASGSGTVTSVAGDIKYGNCVTIDHGNGYITIYRNAGESLVHEGDPVSRGTTLFVVGSDNTKLGFQIQKDGSYINPEELVEING